MQAVKDAGIVVIVLTLLVTVRIHKIDPAQTSETGSLMTQTEAAPPPPAASEATGEIDRDAPTLWVTTSGENATESAAESVFQLDTAEHCSEILVRIRDAVDTSGGKALAGEVEKVIQARPCPRA